MSGPWIALILTQSVLLIILGVIVVGLLSQIGEVLESLDSKATLQPGPSHLGPAVGSPIPSFTATTAEGATIRSSELWNGHTVLLFVSPRCRPCHALLTELKGRQRPLQDAALVLVTPDAARLTDDDIDARILVDSDRRIMGALSIQATPAALSVDASGKVANPAQHVHSLTQLQSLTETAVPRPTTLTTSPPQGDRK
ncbi:TlpA family protein disulfide reductase [Nocardia sp. IFM 10818]